MKGFCRRSNPTVRTRVSCEGKPRLEGFPIRPISFGRALSARKKAVGKRLREVGTFDSDTDLLPMEQREYRKAFWHDATRYVNWEAGLNPAMTRNRTGGLHSGISCPRAGSIA